MVKIRFFEKFKMAAILDRAIRPPGGMCTFVNQVFENLIPIPITMQKPRKGAARAELLWIRIQLIHDFHVFSKFGQNHIFGLYGKTRYFKQLHLIQNVLRHSKTTFPWLSSHVVWFAVSILYLTHNMCKENVFWPIFGPKLGHFGGHFEFYGSNLKNDFKNEFLDPKYILKHRSHLIFWLLFLFLWLF